MSEQQEHDKSEKATPFKLKEARKRGQVTKSMEINSVFIIGVMLGLSYLMGETLFHKQLNISRAIFTDKSLIDISPSTIIGFFEVVTKSLINISWPYLVAIIVTPIIITMAQTGVVFSFHPMKPDLKRINPVEGFKRLFSIRLLYESFKTIVKIGLFGLLIYLSISNTLPLLMSLIDRSPDNYSQFILHVTLVLGFQMLVVMLIVGVGDIVYTRWDFAKKMRMSRREVKDEVKKREGDPLIRSKRRELQKEAVKRAGAMRRVPEADVLITNPTRLAIALKYDRSKMIAPSVIAKGSGDIARSMRELAKRNGINIVENKPLARKLFKLVDIDQPVPEKLYPLVAKIFIAVYSRQSVVNRGGERHVTV